MDGCVTGTKMINACVFECLSLLLLIKENVVLHKKKVIRHLFIHSPHSTYGF